MVTMTMEMKNDEQILHGGKETGTKDGISYNERKIEKEEVAPNLLSASARFHM